MNTIDQVMYYTNGLKSRTRSYFKLEDPESLSKAMDLAIKYENTHFNDDHHGVNRQRSKFNNNTNSYHGKDMKKKKFTKKGGAYKSKAKFISG
jgi:hypothetical protein